MDVPKAVKLRRVMLLHTISHSEVNCIQGKTEIFHVSLIGLLFGLYHDANEKNNNEPPYEGPLTLYADDYTI